MPFFQIDDQLHVNQKATALAERALGGDLVGVAALGLWTMAGSVCQSALSDGEISRTGLMKILLNEKAVDLLASHLVEVNLWHAPGHACDRCPIVAEGHYLFHDWFALGYDTGANVRLARDKRKELKSPELIAAVWARDATDFPACSTGRCRYCGTTVYKKTTKGDTRPEMDHVNPALSAGVRNIVLSCAGCNRTKGRRTPEQAGLVLLPPPERKAVSVPSSLTTAPSGQQVVAPEASNELRPVEAVKQDLASSFGLNLNAPTAAVSVPSSLTTAPSGQQVVAPETSNAHQVHEPQAEGYHWEDDDPEYPAAMTRIQTRPDQQEGSELINEPRAIHGHVYAGARAGRAGQGRDGLTLGLPGEGKPDVSSDETKPRRSRSRSRRRGKRSPNPAGTEDEVLQTELQEQQVPNPHDAGSAPRVLTGGRFGSAYYGVKGQRAAPPESVCQVHGLDMPCRRCQDNAERKFGGHEG